MQIEILNNFLGDNKVEIDTDSEEGKAKVAELFQNLLKSGTAIFLERADQTYRITGYDQATDSLKVTVPVPARAPALPAAPEAVIGVSRQLTNGASCRCQRCEGCKNALSERSRTGICSACQQNKHGGRKLESHRGRHRVVSARPRPQRGDRVTAVAPRAGG